MQRDVQVFSSHIKVNGIDYFFCLRHSFDDIIERLCLEQAPRFMRKRPKGGSTLPP